MTTHHTSPKGTHVTSTPDDQQPAEFAAFLVGHLNGRTHEEIGRELHQLIQAVTETGKKGSLSVTVVIDPPSNGVDGGPLAIGVETALKLPKAVPPKAIYFVDAGGNPTRQDPRQTAFDFRDVPATTTELRSI